MFDVKSLYSRFDEAKKSQQRIAEKVGVVSIVESKLKFIKITVKMLHRNL